MIYKIPITERIYGPDLLLHISQVYAKLGTSIFLCGNNCNLVQKKLTQLFPRLVVAGSYEMMGKKYSASLVKGVNNEIAKTKPSCVFIGIGSPNQHLLASKLNIQLPILCVGAGFDFIAGVEKQAPLWMRNNGFEWLYRLIHNPRRLWKRYLIFGPLFMILVAYKRLSMKVFH